ncbi:hypothetical protein ACFL0T_07330 [Candidatus Omnitrophota bacterium]
MDKIIAGIIGLISGAIASLFAPWIHWGIEKRRIKYKHRLELLKQWRSIVALPSFDRSNMLESSYYGSLRELLKEDIRKEIERSANNLTLVIDSPTTSHDKDLLLREIARIEKEWGLL